VRRPATAGPARWETPDPVRERGLLGTLADETGKWKLEEGGRIRYYDVNARRIDSSPENLILLSVVMSEKDDRRFGGG
jgi:hypothetical protein